MARNFKSFGYKIIMEIPYKAIQKNIDDKTIKSGRFNIIYELSKTSKLCQLCKDKEVTCAKLGIGKDGGKHWDLYDDNDNAFNIDHILPKSKGGKNDISNYQLSCLICNDKKADKIQEGYIFKYLKKFF